MFAGLLAGAVSGCSPSAPAADGGAHYADAAAGGAMADAASGGAMRDATAAAKDAAIGGKEDAGSPRDTTRDSSAPDSGIAHPSDAADTTPASSTRDAATPDAPMMDGSPSDSSAPDASWTEDAATTDDVGTTQDAKTPDAGQGPGIVVDAGAPDAGPRDAGPPAPLMPTVTAALSDGPIVGDPRDAVATFSIATVRELFIYTTWSNLDGEHYEIRQFKTPSGDLYYQKMIPFSTALDEPAPFTLTVDIPHATVIQPVQPDANGNLVVNDYIAVGGSWIGDHQITGTWTLQVYLDGASTPSSTQTFELVP
jgi:hypothetical protein